MRSTYHFVSAVEGLLRKNVKIADETFPVLPDRLRFSASNREQTFQTDRIERTISIPSGWEEVA